LSYSIHQPAYFYIQPFLPYFSVHTNPPILLHPHSYFYHPPLTLFFNAGNMIYSLKIVQCYHFDIG
jgi:hypothetical protein